ncbi:uncharacterized protein LOC113371158 [Ctenocephalides felis]|uniref:uncharacterized protein LOC113371158 n=1 Tax=Ctenocephalides felis TaxID=7515 RepID=UPI000E6E3550|nr:uncharacterized protein LOC113371158 [Ctenocephalides felis]
MAQKVVIFYATVWCIGLSNANPGFIPSGLSNFGEVSHISDGNHVVDPSTVIDTNGQKYTEFASDNIPSNKGSFNLPDASSTSIDSSGLSYGTDLARSGTKNSNLGSGFSNAAYLPNIKTASHNDNLHSGSGHDYEQSSKNSEIPEQYGTNSHRTNDGPSDQYRTDYHESNDRLSGQFGNDRRGLDDRSSDQYGTNSHGLSDHSSDHQNADNYDGKYDDQTSHNPRSAYEESSTGNSYESHSVGEETINADNDIEDVTNGNVLIFLVLAVVCQVWIAFPVLMPGCLG